MNAMRGAVCVGLLALSACGGGGGGEVAQSAPASTPAPVATPAADPGFGDVAFATYEGEGQRLVFTNSSKVKKTWANMSGDAVAGTYTKNGKEIEVQWDAAAEHHGSLSEKYQQTGPCSLARYERVDREGGVHDDPIIFERKKPLCDTVRVTQ
jgi:hypothetical protein